MPTFRARPIEIEAIQWNGNNYAQCVYFVNERVLDYSNVKLKVYDYLQDVWVPVNMFDWIIKGTRGEFYPCENGAFHEKYELIIGDPIVSWSNVTPPE